jgi:hypothetical protein
MSDNGAKWAAAHGIFKDLGTSSIRLLASAAMQDCLKTKGTGSRKPFAIFP